MILCQEKKLKGEAGVVTQEVMPWQAEKVEWLQLKHMETGFTRRLVEKGEELVREISNIILKEPEKRVAAVVKQEDSFN